MVDAESRLWHTAVEARPAWAALLIGGAVTDVVDFEPVRRARLLEELARRAVQEEMG
jgi:hypothetical protein